MRMRNLGMLLILSDPGEPTEQRTQNTIGTLVQEEEGGAIALLLDSHGIIVQQCDGSHALI